MVVPYFGHARQDRRDREGEAIGAREVATTVAAIAADRLVVIDFHAAELDAWVAEFCNRPLDGGPYKYLWIDALTQKVREGGRVVNVAAVIATVANAEGRREIAGFDIVTTEDTAAWTEFLRSPPGA